MHHGEGELNGANALGDFGLQAGTQPVPGLYIGGFYANDDTHSVSDRDGDEISISPDADPSRLGVNVISPFAWWVTGVEVLGASYSVLAVLPFANSRLQVPVLGADLETSWGLGDLYVQPVKLGGRAQRADFMAGAGVFVPTGRYGDVGSGMWSYELFAGSTLYLDAQRRWHVAATAFWETHSKKDDSEQKVGDLLTVEGGLGASLKDGALSVGTAYYAQWKLTEDEFGTASAPKSRCRSRPAPGSGGR